MVEPTLLYAYWEITGEGRGRAQAALGEAGLLCLRIFSAGAHGTSTRDQDVYEEVGEWFLHGMATGARHRAAIGLRGGSGKFVPIAHSGPMWTPLPEPSPDTRVEWMEVRIPGGRTITPVPPQILGKTTADVRAQALARRRAVEGWPMGSSDLSPRRR
jgi:hypothetical protein